MLRNAKNRPYVSSPSSGAEECWIAGVDEIRSQFPALERTIQNCPVAYFDGPGGTQVPRSVATAISDYLVHHNANTHWNYPTSAETDEILSQARAAMAEFLGGAPQEVVFGANATSLAFHVSRALAALISDRDEIVVTELDHHANIGPWQALARESGCTIRVVKMDCESGTLDWGDFEQKVNRNTKLIAIGAASNALGTVNDIQRAARLARAVGSLLFVDAVHYVPHYLADAIAWDCDFLVASAYKFYGPHIGVMWCRRELLESLPFSKVQPSPKTAPERAETGTLNHEGIAGATAAINFLASIASGQDRRDQLRIAFGALDERSAALTQHMWHGLSEIEGVTVFGPPPNEPRTSTISFTMRGVPSSQIAGHLADRGVFVSHGNFYAATVVERFGLGPEGFVRAGCACYTTIDEVDRLLAGVSEIGRS